VKVGVSTFILVRSYCYIECVLDRAKPVASCLDVANSQV
jgi:hypothetical protein